MGGEATEGRWKSKAAEIRLYEKEYANFCVGREEDCFDKLRVTEFLKETMKLEVLNGNLDCMKGWEEEKECDKF
jgi:hypothetical protein